MLVVTVVSEAFNSFINRSFLQSLKTLFYLICLAYSLCVAFRWGRGQGNWLSWGEGVRHPPSIQISEYVCMSHS